MTNEELIENLIIRTKGVINQLVIFEELSLEQLNWKSNAETWSILECIEHLNLYGEFYLEEIEKLIFTAKTNENSSTFKSTWLGNYFAKSMLPKKELNKMKTFKNMNPSGSNLSKISIQKLKEQQRTILRLLGRSQNVNLSKNKIKTMISSLIKMNLGDAFRFVIYHNQRHMLQAKNVLKSQ